MTITKEQALTKIQELQQYIKRLEEKEGLQHPTFDLGELYDKNNETPDILIEGEWAFSILKEYTTSGDKKGAIVSGYYPALFLTTCEGTWYDEDGRIIQRHLYYKPNKGGKNRI